MLQTYFLYSPFRLKPLHTFKLQGPTIDQCMGVQAGKISIKAQVSGVDKQKVVTCSTS